MKSVYNFVVTPKGDRYNNTKKIGDTELILNTRIEEHKNINRKATVLAIPKYYKTNVKVGDEVIIHHNIFRKSSSLIKGILRRSAFSFFAAPS